MILLFVMLLFPQMTIAQVDEIILPEIELVIEDRSTLSTTSYEEAILRDRSPQFQDVFLDEISTIVRDVSIARALSQKDYSRVAFIRGAYGSFNNINATAYSQNIIDNVFYKIFYDGQSRQNVRFKDIAYENTAQYQHIFNAKVDTDTKNMLLEFEFSYEQYDSHFINNQNQNIQYIPIDFNVRLWVSEKAHIDIDMDSGFAIIQLQDNLGIVTDDKLLIDGVLSLMYKANFNDKNYFEVNGTYQINDYTDQTANTGIITIKNDFIFLRSFILRIGFGLVSSSENVIFGWPEVALIYKYLDFLTWDIVASGDFNLFDAQKSSKENQLFSFSPSPESRWIYSSSIKYTPNALFELGANVSYSDYTSKRIYEYDGEMYSFNTIDKADVVEVGANIGVNVEDYFDMQMSYHYQHIPSDWLLYSPHIANVVANIGYKPIGFNFQTSYSLYAPRLLAVDNEAPMAHLLNFKVSQKIKNIAELFIEVNNVLDQDIQFIAGTFYGGIQANGGVTINF